MCGARKARQISNIIEVPPLRRCSHCGGQDLQGTAEPIAKHLGGICILTTSQNSLHAESLILGRRQLQTQHPYTQASGDCTVCLIASAREPPILNVAYSGQLIILDGMVGLQSKFKIFLSAASTQGAVSKVAVVRPVAGSFLQRG